jgi:hypothetical protein
MTSIKINRAINLYTGFKGPRTIQAIIDTIPDALLGELSSKRITSVMTGINTAYRSGMAAAGAEMVDTNCVWVGAQTQKLIEWDISRDGSHVNPRFV